MLLCYRLTLQMFRIIVPAGKGSRYQQENAQKPQDDGNACGQIYKSSDVIIKQI